MSWLLLTVQALGACVLLNRGFSDGCAQEWDWVVWQFSLAFRNLRTSPQKLNLIYIPTNEPGVSSLFLPFRPLVVDCFSDAV